MQQSLINLGYPIQAGATGYFGNQTKAALSKFQIDNGLSPDFYLLGIAVGPWTYSKLTEKSSAQQVSPQSKSSSGPGVDCDDNPPALPAGCEILKGSDALARWLQCWADNGSIIPVLGSCAAAGIKTVCDLSDSQIDTIKYICKEKTSLSLKLDCVARQVNLWVGQESPSSVCRHYARCTKKVLEAMEIEQSFTPRWMSSADGHTKDGHTWNQVVGELNQVTGTYYVDSFNNILYWCPNS